MFCGDAVVTHDFTEGVDTRYEYVCDGFFSAELLEENGSPIYTKVNRKMREFFETNLSREVIESQFIDLGWPGEPGTLELWGYDWQAYIFGTRWALFTPWWMMETYDNDTNKSYTLPHTLTAMLYDLKTGERISPEAMLKDGWREHSYIVHYYEDLYLTTDDITFDRYMLLGLHSYVEDGKPAFTMSLYNEETDINISFRIDPDYINFE